MLLAGCTQVDDAQRAIDDAKREAQEAKDRYDRVASATVVRNETLRVVVVPMGNGTEIRFDVGVWRGETALDTANLTTVPPVAVRAGESRFVCDPLTCRVAVTGVDVNVTWADGAPGGVTLAGGQAACAPGSDASSSYCAFPQIERLANVRVTTALSDAGV